MYSVLNNLTSLFSFSLHYFATNYDIDLLESYTISLKTYEDPDHLIPQWWINTMMSMS